jgi:acetyl esterase/lipase
MQTLAFLLLFAVVVMPTTGHAAMIPLYPDGNPDAARWTQPERSYHSTIFGTEVVTNVSEPSLRAYPVPRDRANGAAVVIAPGGGFHALSIDSEGTDVARWLNERGIGAFVLRYRLVPTGEDGVAELIAKAPEVARTDMAAFGLLAGEDGLQAMRIVRSRAAEWGIDPDRIGFMGFSAGGAVAATVAFGYDEATRPAFVAPIYAGLGAHAGTGARPDAPPMFVAAATDDQLGLARDSVALYQTWLDAGRSAELHLYARGGHGFGMRTQNLPTDGWIERFGDWLGVIGVLGAP